MLHLLKNLIHTKLVATSILGIALPLMLTGICQASPANEKPITVIITSYNNASWYKQNLHSVFTQNYQNYKVIYIDDASTDNTGQLVEQYIKEQKQEERVTLIKNKRNMSQMANHYKAVHMCDDNDIIVHLDGDDFLANGQVLETVNDAYADPNVWITFGRYKEWPLEIEQPPFDPVLLTQVIEANSFRTIAKAFFPFSHLRTFYAWLFKHIKLQDLIYSNSFDLMSPAPDVAFMLPMLEMAGPHCKNITDITYIYNRKNPLSQYNLNLDKVTALTKAITQWPKYKPLDNPDTQISKRYSASKADIIVLIKDCDAMHIVCAIKKAFSNIGKVFIIGDRSAGLALKNNSDTIRKLGLAVTYHWCSFDDNRLKNVLLRVLATAADHVVLALNTIAIQPTTEQPAKQSIDTTYCIQQLEKTFAYAVCLNAQTPDKNNNHITDTIIARQLESATQANNPAMAAIRLYRNKDIKHYLENISFMDYHQVNCLWSEQKKEARTVELLLLKDNYNAKNTI